MFLTPWGAFRKKLDAAGCFESFFSHSLERHRSVGTKAHRCMHNRAPVFDRRQSLASLKLVWTGWETYSSAQELRKHKPSQIEGPGTH